MKVNHHSPIPPIPSSELTSNSNTVKKTIASVPDVKSQQIASKKGLQNRNIGEVEGNSKVKTAFMNAIRNLAKKG